MTSIYPLLALCLLLCALYAVLLSTRPGREFATAKTWVVVVVGCALVLGVFACYWPAAAKVAALFFVAGGLPLVVRAVLDEFNRDRRIVRRQQRE